MRMTGLCIMRAPVIRIFCLSTYSRYIHSSSIFGEMSGSGNAYTSSIRASSHPLNCMTILCSVVPWRRASTLGAAA